MNYEEKYKEALERMKSWARGEHPECFSEAQKAAEFIFPELKGSEDEKIRKDIISYLRNEKIVKRYISDIEIDEWIAWLEKQGKQEPISITDEWIEDYWKHHKVINPYSYDKGEEIQFDHRGFIKFCKNYCKKPTDKVEPKFKVGNWIVFNGLILHIDEVVNGYYRTTSIGDGIHNSYDWDIDNIARLWTIADAGDGDILATWAGAFIYNGNNDGIGCPGSYCGINTLGRFQIGGEKHWTGKKVYPATKEQRDTLFAKMKEAGYKWDTEKKELKKVKIEKLAPDKVIEWLNDQACQGWIEDVEVDKFVDQCKKDFGL